MPEEDAAGGARAGGENGAGENTIRSATARSGSSGRSSRRRHLRLRRRLRDLRGHLDDAGGGRGADPGLGGLRGPRRVVPAGGRLLAAGRARAAPVGLLLALGGIGLHHQITGSSFFDGLASLLIGVLLSGVAYILGRTNKGLLIGRQADARLVYGIRDHLTARPEVEKVVDLLTMMLGTDRVLVCARLDFDDALGAADLERACTPACMIGSRRTLRVSAGR